ncbi:artemis protein [Purpureocillium lavendulum]|uniref:Artemis protein n=1 Tax=Purpureocillium lavendulum TaxID=1247861 RepID=A0AB34FHS9_9HYPO|nr:artemis protein [Purpureocillium lavendulum]
MERGGTARASSCDKGKLIMSILRGEIPGYGPDAGFDDDDDDDAEDDEDNEDNDEGVSTAVSTAGDSPQLVALLQEDADLRLWLEYTRYFDPAHRERVLEGIKKLRAVEEERDKLLQELQSTAVTSPVSASMGSFTPAPVPSSMTTHAGSTALVPFIASGSIAASFTEDSLSSGVSPLAIRRRVGEGVALAMPKPIARATTQDSRFFLIKCFNTANVYLSQRDGLWVTQAKNSTAFTEAFQQCKSVLLFFSINKSHGFQGVARMTSAPDKSIRKPSWIANINLTAVTPPFRVEWIVKSEVDFDRFADIQNPLNEDRAVVVGRDGQEYPSDVGRTMLAIMKAAPAGNRASILARRAGTGPLASRPGKKGVADHAMSSRPNYQSDGHRAAPQEIEDAPGRSDSPFDKTNRTRTLGDWRQRDATYLESPPSRAQTSSTLALPPSDDPLAFGSDCSPTGQSNMGYLIDV